MPEPLSDSTAVTIKVGWAVSIIGLLMALASTGGVLAGDLEMRQVLFALLVIVVIGSVFVASQDKAMFREAQGFMPDVVRVTAKMPDKGRICVEVPGGLDACRPIGDLRKWVQERTAKEP